MNDPECDKQECGMAVKVWHGSLHGASGRWGEQIEDSSLLLGGPIREINRFSIWWRRGQNDPFSLINVPVKTSPVVVLTGCRAHSPAAAGVTELAMSEASSQPDLLTADGPVQITGSGETNVSLWGWGWPRLLLQVCSVGEAVWPEEGAKEEMNNLHCAWVNEQEIDWLFSEKLQAEDTQESQTFIVVERQVGLESYK